MTVIEPHGPTQSALAEIDTLIRVRADVSVQDNFVSLE